MTVVAVSGAGGRMGSLVAETVAGREDLELGALYDPENPGGEIAGVVVGDDPSPVAAADVVVEFTRPDVVMENLARWRALDVNAVVGTSGFDEARMAEIGTIWGSGPPNVLVVPNFSIGAVVMMQLAERAAPYFDGAEIIEMHHEKKVDAPSGTAIATARRIGGDPPIHSVRLPGLVAHQVVLFGGTGETLTIRHDTTDRSAFMPGVVLAVRAVAGLDEPVSFGLEAVLSSEQG